MASSASPSPRAGAPTPSLRMPSSSVEIGLALVIDTDRGDEKRLMANLDAAAGSYVGTTLRSGDVVGRLSSCSASRLATVVAMQLAPELRDLRIVQAAEGIGDRAASRHATRLTGRYTGLVNGKAVHLPRPERRRVTESARALGEDPPPPPWNSSGSRGCRRRRAVHHTLAQSGNASKVSATASCRAAEIVGASTSATQRTAALTFSWASPVTRRGCECQHPRCGQRSGGDVAVALEHARAEVADSLISGSATLISDQ